MELRENNRRDGDVHPVKAYPRDVRLFYSRLTILLLSLAIICLLYNDRCDFSREASLRVLSNSSSVDPDKASMEAAKATELAAAAAAELVDTLDSAREAANRLKRVAAVAAHKRRVVDRAVAAAKAGDKAFVRERKINLKDGSEASFSVFGRSDDDVSVFVLPYDTKTKQFTLIEEYHPGPNRKMNGLVAGMFEAKHGGSPEKAAIWELSEEANLKLGGKTQLIPLAPETVGGFSQDKYSSAHFQPFLALDCEADERPRQRDREEDITVHRNVSPEDLTTMINTGKMNVPSTAFAMMGLHWLEKNNLI